MTPVIVDASVAAKWFFPEAGAASARRLLDGRHVLLAPDLLPIEFGNIVWKMHRHGRLSAGEVEEIIREFQSMPVEIAASQALVPMAVNLAVTTGRTVYDSLYLALAIQQDGVVWTADERFVNAVKGTDAVAGHVRLLGNR